MTVGGIMRAGKGKQRCDVEAKDRNRDKGVDDEEKQGGMEQRNVESRKRKKKPVTSKEDRWREWREDRRGRGREG